MYKRQVDLVHQDNLVQLEVFKQQHLTSEWVVVEMVVIMDVSVAVEEVAAVAAALLAKHIMELVMVVDLAVLVADLVEMVVMAVVLVVIKEYHLTELSILSREL